MFSVFVKALQDTMATAPAFDKAAFGALSVDDNAVAFQKLLDAFMNARTSWYPTEYIDPYGATVDSFNNVYNSAWQNYGKLEVLSIFEAACKSYVTMSAQFTELGVLSELYDSLVAIDLGLTSNLPLVIPRILSKLGSICDSVSAALTRDQPLTPTKHLLAVQIHWEISHGCPSQTVPKGLSAFLEQTFNFDGRFTNAKQASNVDR